MPWKMLVMLAVFALGFIASPHQDTHLSATPSPAPSKTPTAIATHDLPIVITQTQTGFTGNPLTQRFNQADLSVLTGNVQRPNALTWHNNKLYTVCSGDWTVYEIDSHTGATMTYIYGVKNAHTIYVEDIANDDINLWIPDFDTNSLLRVNRNRAPDKITSDLKGPWGIAYFDPNHFLITNLLSSSISLLSRDGEASDLVTGLRSPTGIVVDGDYVYVANNGSSRRAIEWMSRDSITASDAQTDQLTHPLVSGLQSTTGLALGPDGYLYFAYSLGTRGVVGRINPAQCRENGCSNDQIETVVYSELAAPLAGLTVSPDMRLFIHTIFRPEIYWVQLPS